jgi:hypothetical protein
LDTFNIPDKYLERKSSNELVARVYGPDIPTLDAPGARAALLEKAAMLGLITPGVADMGGCIPASEEDKIYGSWWREIRVQGSI